MRDLTGASDKLMRASDEWLQDRAKHDPDFFRDVGAALHMAEALTSATSTQDERNKTEVMLGYVEALVSRIKARSPGTDVLALPQDAGALLWLLADRRRFLKASWVGMEKHLAQFTRACAAETDRDLWKRRAEEAEGERDDAYVRWSTRMADIREASGVGVKPMLDEVATAIKAKVDALEARALAAETRLREAVTGLESIRDYRISTNPLPADTEYDLAILTHVGRLRTLALLALSSISPQGKDLKDE